MYVLFYLPFYIPEIFDIRFIPKIRKDLSVYETSFRNLGYVFLFPATKLKKFIEIYILTNRTCLILK